MLRANAILLVPVLASVLSACGGGTASSASAPATTPTVSLAAIPTSVTSGGNSMLTWSSTNVTSCTASGGWSGTKATSGSQSTAALTASGNYSLTCTGSGGSASASATVTVPGTPPPSPVPTVSLAANPTLVANGATSTLTWSSTNATSCTASGASGWTGTKATSGSQPTGALTSTSTFNLVCNGSGGTASASATVTISTPPVGAQSFSTRCAQPGVIKCVGFDAASDISGTYGSNSGILPGDATPALDTGVRASGASSLKFTIPSNSGANSSGSYFTNFSSDLLTQFGADTEFYIQWRQRFSPEFLNTFYQGGGGWKQAIIGTGDKPGCTSGNSASSLCYSSCTALETVVQNTNQRRYAQMYNSCSGSASHGAFAGFEEPFAGSDFKLQNARPSPFCLYSSTGAGTQFPPTGNCFGYFPNEWMTFQVKIKTGPRVGDEWRNSVVSLWIARENQQSELVINFPWNLTAGSAGEDQKFGKVWLLPYNTGKSSAQSHQPAFTWYDELIISRTQIADPAP